MMSPIYSRVRTEQLQNNTVPNLTSSTDRRVIFVWTTDILSGALDEKNGTASDNNLLRKRYHCSEIRNEESEILVHSHRNLAWPYVGIWKATFAPSLASTSPLLACAWPEEQQPDRACSWDMR